MNDINPRVRLSMEEAALLAELMKSELFSEILRAVAADNRPDIITMTVDSYNVQNVYAAAVNAGTLQTLETLPIFFQRLLSSQPKSEQ